jgi:AAA ATPase domain
MDPVRNPFAPGAGNPPPELAGRDALLENMKVSLARAKAGRSAKSIILVGLRGVGKTVLLVRIREMAEDMGFIAFMLEAHEGKSLPALLIPVLRQALYTIDLSTQTKVNIRKAFRVLKSFIGSVKLSIGGVDFELGVDPEKGSADSGDLEIDLPSLFEAVGHAARDSHRSILICIDEMQYLSEAEFSALIISIHKCQQLQLPITVIGAGLPQILGLAGESKSYAERLFEFPFVGPLHAADARQALQRPVLSEGATFTEAALDEILKVTEQYPYFLQQWGYESWNVASGDVIDADVIPLATRNAINSLDQSFFQVRFDRCTPSEKRYMRALAELGPGAHRSGEIADILRVKITSVGPVRSKLITKGMIYSPQHGDTEFTVPLFDAYMRRAMSGEDWKQL